MRRTRFFSPSSSHLLRPGVLSAFLGALVIGTLFVGILAVVGCGDKKKMSVLVPSSAVDQKVGAANLLLKDSKTNGSKASDAKAMATKLNQPVDDAARSVFKDKAEKFVNHLTKGEYAKATAGFNATLKANLKADQLGKMWKSIGQDHGAFIKVGASRQQTNPDQVQAVVPVHFERGIVEFHLIFDKASTSVVGIKALALDEPAPASQPSIEDAFVTRDLQGGAKGWPLPGTLLLPKANPLPRENLLPKEQQKRLAAVVFIHDAGPYDRDESLGANKLFAELAKGLARRGIASYRYDSRRLVHEDRIKKMPNITPQQESVDDALAAVALLRKQPEIDPQKIVMIGHGQGGTTTPRILAQDQKIAGAVLLGAEATPLEDAIVRQVRVLMNVDKKLTSDEKTRLAEIERQAAAVKKLKAGVPNQAKLPFDISPAYWLYLRAHAPSVELPKSTAPLLVLQGTRDAQVNGNDLATWQKALKGRKNAMSKSYPSLDHLFHEGKGISTPIDVMKPGIVPLYVFDDIKAWIARIAR